MLKARLFLAAYRVANVRWCRPWLKTPLIGVSLGAFSTAEGYRLNEAAGLEILEIDAASPGRALLAAHDPRVAPRPARAVAGTSI